MIRFPVEPGQFLQATELINSTHPDILAQAEKIVAGVNVAEDKAERLFYFIRDQISYIFQVNRNPFKYSASEILKTGKGFCIQKAILFCALARSCGIPAGLHFFDIRDYTLPPQFVKILGTQMMFHHGIVALFLRDQWLKYDATLHLELVLQKNCVPVEFFPDRDCLLHPQSQNGARHIEYVHDYGLQSDISFEQIMSWFRQGYPHLFQNTGSSAY